MSQDGCAASDQWDDLGGTMIPTNGALKKQPSPASMQKLEGSFERHFGSPASLQVPCYEVCQAAMEATYPGYRYPNPMAGHVPVATMEAKDRLWSLYRNTQQNLGNCMYNNLLYAVAGWLLHGLLSIQSPLDLTSGLVGSSSGPAKAWLSTVCALRTEPVVSSSPHRQGHGGTEPQGPGFPPALLSHKNLKELTRGLLGGRPAPAPACGEEDNRLKRGGAQRYSNAGLESQRRTPNTGWPGCPMKACR